MKISEVKRFIEQADELWSLEYEMYRKYCGKLFSDGTPSHLLGLEGRHILLVENDNTYFTDEKIRTIMLKLLTVVEEEAGYLLTYITGNAFQEHLMSENFENEKFPDMNQDAMREMFKKEKKDLLEKYIKLIDTIMFWLGDE